MSPPTLPLTSDSHPFLLATPSEASRLRSPRIQGWCPGALQPMRAGDGWVVRVRPPGGRLTQAQAAGIAALATQHAADAIELTGRANLQLRGVSDAAYPPLLAGLQALGLVDSEVSAESRRNLLVTPFWAEGDGTTTLAVALAAALGQGDAPALPAKFGFALDTGPLPVMRAAPADIRIERSGDAYRVYADGFATGARAGADEVVPLALSLAQWFIDTTASRTGRQRMAALAATDAQLPPRFADLAVPSASAYQPRLGAVTQGLLVGFEFGQLSASTLTALSALAPMRLTPWRSLLIEGIDQLPDLPDLITRTDDKRLRLSACTGAPACAQAAGVTRPLARALAASLPAGKTLHVSGCTKGCAHPSAALTVVATRDGYDLIHHGNAASPPDARGLSPSALALELQKLEQTTEHATPL